MRPSRARQPGFLERHREELVKAGFIVPALAVVGWALVALYGLNRELGEQKQALQGLSQMDVLLNDRIQRIETRADQSEKDGNERARMLQDRVDRANDRISELRDMLGDPGTLTGSSGRLRRAPPNFEF